MISIKQGVRLAGLKVEMMVALQVVASVYEEHRYSVTITSALDRVHAVHSRHYLGMALDFRIRHIRSCKLLEQIVKAIKDALGEEYNVRLEKDHLHISFKPRGIKLA